MKEVNYSAHEFFMGRRNARHHRRQIPRDALERAVQLMSSIKSRVSNSRARFTEFRSVDERTCASSESFVKTPLTRRLAFVHARVHSHGPSNLQVNNHSE